LELKLVHNGIVEYSFQSLRRLQMKKKITTGRILLYSSASAGLNIMAITLGTWILYFYAPPPDSGRMQFLPVTLVGVLMTVTSLWDAVIDPFIGHWSDSLRGRRGRRRPFLLYASPVAAVALVLLWTPPGGENYTVNAIYFFFVMLIYSTAFSLVGIPYDGSMPEMAEEPKDLVKLSMWKQIFGILGVLVGSLVAAPLFDSIGPLSMGLVVAVVGLATVWMTLGGLRETERPVGEPMAVIEGIRATLANKQFLFMFISTLIVHVAYAMLQANLPYFVTLVLGGSEADVGIYLGVVVILMMAFAPFWNLISKKFAHRKLMMVSIVSLAVAAALNFFVGMVPGIPINIQGFIALGLIGPTLGGYFVLAYAMMGSVVDYDEMFTNRRREAIYYGTFSLAVGLGPSLSALILPPILENFGYTAANPFGVRLAWLVTSVIALLGGLAFLGYKLGDTPEETRELMRMEIQ
jgi:GPH family glycoside/pentoside/hexuronide:cation symporter